MRFPGGFEYGSGQTVGFRTGFGLQGSVRYIGERDSDDYAEIEGLDNVDWSFEAGLGVGYEQRNCRVFADVRYGFIGHNAWVGEIGADGIAYPIDGLTLTLGPRLDFGDDRFTDTYFGVSAEESAALGPRRVRRRAAACSAPASSSARATSSTSAGASRAPPTWDRLLNDAADSPITEDGLARTSTASASASPAASASTSEPLSRRVTRRRAAPAAGRGRCPGRRRRAGSATSRISPCSSALMPSAAATRQSASTTPARSS